MNGAGEDEPLDARVAALFAADEPGLDSAALSRRAFNRVTPLLAAHAQLAFRRRVVRTLGLALLPLPLVLAADALLLGWLYEVATAWLPSGLATYLIGSYALAVLVGLALTYASIPLLLAARLPGGSSDEVIA